MGKTITAPATTGRTITYSVAGGQSIELNYVRFSYSTRNIMEGRQFTKRIWEFRFSFVIAGSTPANLQTILVNCNKALNQRGGRLQIVQDGNLLVDAGPAQFGNLVSSGNLFGTYSTDLTNVMTDIGWGPTPGEFRVETIQGNTAIASWTLSVESPAEDAYVRLDSLVLAISASVNYSIDQNHYSVRSVVGKVTVANWGRYGIDWNRSFLSQADAQVVRKALISRDVTSVGWMDPILIPTGFVRVVEDWSVDETENVMQFVIVDREVYRGFPAYITSADAKMQVDSQGTTAAQWLKHTLSGYCEAPSYVSKFRVLAAVWETILSAMAFLTEEGSESYVPGFTFVNHIYRNRIEYSVTAYSPLIDSTGQVMRLDKALGIGAYYSELFFPQGEAGSAGLFGSAYRQENNAYTRFSPPENINTRDPRTEEQAFDDHLNNTLGDNKLLSMKLKVRMDSKINLLSIATAGTTPKVFSYSASGPSLTMKLNCHYTQTYNREVANKKDYSKYLLDSLNSVAGLDQVETKYVSGGVRKGVWQKRDVAMDGFNSVFNVTGVLFDKIVGDASNEAAVQQRVQNFANFLNSKFTTMEVTNTVAFANEVVSYFNNPVTE